MSYDKEEVKELLQPEDIFSILEYFGAEPEERDECYVCKTVCHGGDSHKLYYYFSTQLLNCYTNCGVFDIFDFVRKMTNDDDLNRAILFVVSYCHLEDSLSDSDMMIIHSPEWDLFERMKKLEERQEIKAKKKQVQLPFYDENILKYYPTVHIKDWEKEGIDYDVCCKMNIKYDPVHGAILLPHYDINGKCVGIRQRTFIQEHERMGKYKPWRRGKKLYNHPLAFNLYGLDVSKARIQEMKKAIVVEGEKSVLLFQSYFGFDNNICVATCGNKISEPQFQLLRNLGVEELIFAFDHDCRKENETEILEKEKKLAREAKKFKDEINVSVIWDKTHELLGYKDSPLDCGKDVFVELFKKRIMIR